ncbi:MAG TPA: GAF domain-containing protein [bacterium]|nr:GAF domain-containing protein [bacterium]HNO90066.1 GAF domain-containing protein [bacterium]
MSISVREYFHAIAEATYGKIGDDFFKSLVRNLSSVLKMEFAMVTECANSEKSRLRTIAHWIGMDFGKNFEYDITHTPCHMVIHGGLQCYTEDLPAQFPLEKELSEIQATSYIGIPLKKSNGEIVGHLALLDTRPILDAEIKASILKIFASRAEAELERLQDKRERELLIYELQESLELVQTLRGMLPICASCKKIRDDKGYWNRIEEYVERHSGAQFTHGICPECSVKLYPDL